MRATEVSILDEQGRLLPRSAVEVVANDPVSTDLRRIGVATWRLAAAGRHTHVVASAPGYVSKSARVPVSRRRLTVTLSRAHARMGIVVDDRGRAVDGAEVEVWPKRTPRRREFWNTFDTLHASERGRVRLTRIPSDGVLVVARAAGHGDMEPVLVTPARMPATIVLPRQATVHVRVSVEAGSAMPRSLHVAIPRLDNDYGTRTMPMASWTHPEWSHVVVPVYNESFSVSDLYGVAHGSPGRRVMWILGPNCRPVRLRYVCGPGETATLGPVRLGPGRSFEIRVMSSLGGALSAANVRAKYGPWSMEGRTDANGVFRTTWVPAVPFTLHAGHAEHVARAVRLDAKVASVSVVLDPD